MAEDKGQDPAFAPEVGDPAESEADVLFRAQMGIYNFFAGYWRQLLGVLGVLLLVALGYSLYIDYARDSQRDIQAAIAAIDIKMPKPDPMAAMLGTPAYDPSDEDLMANLAEGARRYEAVAKEGAGAGATMAWLRAADTWQLAGKKDEAIAALQAAHDMGASGVMGWSAGAQLAALKAEAGDADAAAAVYKQFSAGDGFIAEHAALELGLMYESAGRADEASAALTDFVTRFPESVLVPQATEALKRLQG